MQNSLYDIEYYTSGTEENLLKKEIAPSGSSTEYFYNEQRMITSIKEQVDGEPFTTKLVLDEYGRTHKKIFPGPSEFTIIYQYDNHGYLEKITDNSGALIWQIDEKNARGQITEYTLGNGIHLSHVFDPDNYFLTSSIAQNNQGALFNFEYEFNPLNGNLKHRKLGATFEYFEYDNSNAALGLHRLTGSGLSENEMNVDFTYLDNGNVMEKSGVGVYVYDPQKQNQVIEIEYDGGMEEDNPNANIVDQQYISYNHFNSASTIRNLSNELSVELIYGPDDQRRKANYYQGPEGEEVLIKSRFYIGDYEKQIDAANNTIEVHYISAGGMLVAMYVIENEIGKYYYPHQDHLGSIIHITDENAEIVYTQSFDAWGRTRNAEDLSYEDITERPNWLWRGYTGHEHLDEFGLINMNGRLYDPVIGRMLSPDNYVQSPEFSQSYNRYSYVWNNPLKYTDPSGEFVNIIIGAAIGGIINVAMNANNIENFGQGLAYFGIGALAGAAGGGAGQVMSGAVGTVGFFGGAFTGASAGFAGGFVSGTGNALIGGASFGKGIDMGLKAGKIGAATGGLIGGVSGGFSAVKNGGNFWTGKGAKFNFSSSVQFDGEGTPVEYSNKSAKEYSSKYIGNNPKGLNELYADGSVPDGYKLIEGGYALSPNGEHAQGVTEYLGIGGKSNVYLYESAFQSHEQLFLVMKHEYMHVAYFNTGKLMNYNKQEAGARQWMLDQGKAWNYKVDQLQMIHNETSRFLSNKYHYSRLGIQILPTTPW